ncbi:MAG: hypothetical protein KDA71_25535 [Planctomycetales bacterium]|nr:hypothetical protein [Planctomycetales bacterium]
MDCIATISHNFKSCISDYGMGIQKVTTANVGACGEFYVASLLSAHNLSVGLPRGGAARADLFVGKEAGGPALRIQVKTGTQATKNDKEVGPIYLWSTTKKAIDDVDRFFWYAYVWLNEWPNNDRIPKVFFLPSKVVSDCIQKEHQAYGDVWLYFWMRQSDAEQYLGTQGLMNMLRVLESDSNVVEV